MAKEKRTLRHDIFNRPIRTGGINGKQKGNANERDAAKALGAWVGKKFVRVPQSGAIRWADGDKVTGDIVCDEPGYTFPFSVETKHLNAVEIDGELRSNSKVFTIMHQAVTDADRVGKLPMVMLRVNGLKKFTHNGEKLQDYYVVFLNTPVGAFLSTYRKRALWGKGKYAVTGFLLSTLIGTAYTTVEAVVETCKK